MRRLLFLTLGLITLTGLQTITNCSRPLDSIGAAVGQPIDTIFRIDTVIIGETDTIVDTLIIVDTVGGFDTIYQIDTVIVGETDTVVDTLLIVDTVTLEDTVTLIDTIIVIDTVIVVETDTTLLSMNYCGRLSSHRKKIVWMLQNDEGEYRLSFEAEDSKDWPVKELIVEINGHKTRWKAQEEDEWTITQYLSEDAVVKIYPDKPNCYGHAIEICLEVDPL